MTFIVESETPDSTPLGKRTFHQLPRPGDFVEVVLQDHATTGICEVMAVVLSSIGGTADVYLSPGQSVAEFLARLRMKMSVGKAN